ncbi:unnamed protein product [Macrosiphum euphorbiae]|uniref:THAP-type domain-containing protein n=1 Tax=Macrosiphum euphorbiae TaxID=13131 RepID=A0AAV0X2F4_9HEMI|nr:unnamed protein product [Macrosiphum euphorbiae]
MVNCCFVPGCNTGYALDVEHKKKIGLKNKSLFKAPKNTELLARWHRAIPRKDKMLTEKCYVCEVHFKENDILIYDETILNDGTVNKIKRIRPTLKAAGAVPSIFPNLPFYLTEHTIKRKPPLERYINSDKKRFKPSQAYLNTVENSHEEFLFQYLKENLNLLEKPDNKWMFGLTDDEVVIAIWNSGSEKRIIISI